MSISPEEQQAVNYKSSKEDDLETTCLNCIPYGVFENNQLKIPCTNCASENNFMWHGNRCYGSQGEGEITVDHFANNLYFLRYQNRHHIFCEDAKENNGICIDKMLEGIPHEAVLIFMNLFNNNDKIVCDICNPQPQT